MMYKPSNYAGGIFMPKKRKKVKEEKFSERLITGLGLGFVAVAALLALFALLIKNGRLDSDASSWIVVAVNIISAFICGFTVAMKGKGNIIYYGLIPGVIFGLIIALLSIIVNPNAFSMNDSLKILLISAAGSTMGSTLKLCRSNKKYRK